MSGKARPRFRFDRDPLPLAVLVAAVMVLSGLAVIGPEHLSSPGRGAGSAPVSPAAASSVARANVAGSPATEDSRVATVEADRSSLLASGGNLSAFEPPNLHLALPLSQTDGHVQPLYAAAPAPMGIAYYGLSNTTGKVQATVLNTTSLRGYFTTDDPLGVETEQFVNGSRTVYGAQLNAVLTNVTIDGRTAFGPNVNAPDGCSGFITGSTYCPNEFWLQNVINYDPGTHLLTFVDNIWNFSNPGANWATTNGITLVGRSTPANGFYEASGPVIRISYPFTVVLYLNSTVGRCTTGSPGVPSCGQLKGDGPVNEVFFNYTVLDSTGQVVCPAFEYPNSVCGEFDDVFWDSISRSLDPSGVRSGTATMVADGDQYDPAGLTNDWEMDYGIGASDGATTSVSYADAEVGIDYCPIAETELANGRCIRYAAPPAAYDFGGETGETSLGEGAYYVTESGGEPAPSYLAGPGAPVARLVTGPSLFRGLWNTSTPAGAYALEYLSITPGNAWVGIAAGSGTTNQSKFQVAPTFGWYSARAGSGGSPRATDLGPDLYLPPGDYTIEVLLSGYDPVAETLDMQSTGADPTIALTRDPSTGVYTPMWAYSASDLANLSVAGSGTPADPYDLIDYADSSLGLPYVLPGSIAGIFSGLNDYLYPVWLGAYFNSTRSYATFDPAPSFTLSYPRWQWPMLVRLGAPRSDGLRYYLFQAQNVTIEGAENLSAWASAFALPFASVVCDSCFNDLFAKDLFRVSDIGIELTGTGGPMSGLAPYANYPHTRNVLWGSVFSPTCKPGTCGGLFPPTEFVEESDSYDRIYNNNFEANLTVSETSATAVDDWNVTCQAGYTSRAAGFYPGPVPCRPASYGVTMNGVDLTGSVVGTSYQGGNAWANFGDWANPYANIPYVARTTAYASGGIAQPTGGQAGDFAPLISFRVYAVPFVESGLPTTDSPTAFVVSLQGPVTGQNATATDDRPSGCGGLPCVDLFVPNGTYTYGVADSASRYTASPRVGSLSVAGAALPATTVTFSRGHALSLTFREHGIPSGHSWCATLDGYRACSTTGTLRFAGLVSGTYTYAIVRPTMDVTVRLGKTLEPTSGSLSLGRSRTLTVAYVYAYSVMFVETGLGYGNWSVRVNGATHTALEGAAIYFSLGNGTYRFHVLSVRGGYWVPSTGRVQVDGSVVGVTVEFN